MVPDQRGRAGAGLSLAAFRVRIRLPFGALERVAGELSVSGDTRSALQERVLARR